MDTVKTYYRLAKPGIIYGNAITAAAGFLLAARGHINAPLLAAVLVGLSLVIGSACVVNNYTDRGLDAVMARTRKRALVRGRVSGRAALVYAGLLGAVGVAVLARGANALTVLVALIGFFDYVVLYGIAKRRSVHGTIVGSISGAVPIVAGYTAVTNRFDTEALLLFIILVLWQMPHFYAIALYRLSDYKAAGIPVLPAKSGVRAAKVQIMLYILAFIIAATALTWLGYTGYAYLAVMILFGLLWLLLAVKGFKTKNDEHWARGLFRFSLVVLVAFSVMISL